jgi:hypothetical protein
MTVSHWSSPLFPQEAVGPSIDTFSCVALTLAVFSEAKSLTPL